jgi:hypothetical protein
MYVFPRSTGGEGGPLPPSKARDQARRHKGYSTPPKNPPASGHLLLPLHTPPAVPPQSHQPKTQKQDRTGLLIGRQVGFEKAHYLIR